MMAGSALQYFHFILLICASECTGEELTVGTSQNNYLGFETQLTGNTAMGYQGTMVLFWPGAPGGSTGSSCDANVTWPMLTAVSVLGSGPVNTASVAIMVSP